MTSCETRSQILEALRLDLIGPDNDHDCCHELLPESPYRWYLTGYLVPADAPDEIRHDETSRDEIADAATPEPTAPGVDDDQGPPDSRDSGKSFLPSSIGMSLLLPPEANHLEVIARWGDYLREAPDDDPEAVDEPEGEEEHGYALAKHVILPAGADTGGNAGKREFPWISRPSKKTKPPPLKSRTVPGW